MFSCFICCIFIFVVKKTLYIVLFIFPFLVCGQEKNSVSISVIKEIPQQALKQQQYDHDDVYHQWPCHEDSGTIALYIITQPDSISITRPYTFTWETPYGDTTIHCCEEHGVYEGHFYDDRGKRYEYQAVMADGPDTFRLCCAYTGEYHYNAYDRFGYNMSGTFYLSAPPPLEVDTAEIKPPSCDGVDDGYIRSMPTGGNELYSYFYWSTDNGSGIHQFYPIQDSLSPGLYDLTVTDYRGCTGKGSFTVPEAEPILIDEIEKRAASCISLDDGYIEVTAKGGRAPYSYLWDTDNGDGLYLIANPQTTLAPGDYHVTVYGHGNCEGESRTISLGTRNVSAGTARDTGVCSNESLNLNDLLEGNDPYGYFGSDFQSPLGPSVSFSDFPEGFQNFYYKIDPTEFCEGDITHFQILISVYKEAGTGSSQFFCEKTDVNLFSLLNNFDPGGIWLDTEEKEVSNGMLDAKKINPGSNRYTYHIEGDFLCPASSAEILILLDSIKPKIRCPGDENIRINSLATDYQITSRELDPLITENCGYTLTNTLNRESTRVRSFGS